MNPTIPLITLGCCALLTACSGMPGKTKLGDRDSGLDLQNFILPRVQVKNETLESALADIMHDVGAVARLCNEAPPEFRFSYEGNPRARVSADLKNVSLHNALHRLAGQADLRMSYHRGTVKLTPFEQDERISTRTYLVPPTFMTDVALRDWTPGAGGRLQNARIRDADLLPLLRRSHVLTSPAAKAHYDPAVSALHVTSTGTDLERVEAYVEPLIKGTPYMFNIVIRRVTIPGAPAWTTGIVRAAESQRWMRRARQAKGAVIQSLPSVAVRPGKPGFLGLIRESSELSSGRWLGTRVDFQATPLGFGTEIDISYERRVIAHQGQEHAHRHDAGAPRSVTAVGRDQAREAMEYYRNRKQAIPLRRRTANFKGVLPEGHFLILKTSGNSKMSEFVVVEATRIDAAGRPLRGLP